MGAGEPAHAGERNIYRDKFESHYGKGTARDQGDAGSRDDAGREGAVLKVETFFPVFLATAVFAAGWTAVLGGGSLLTVASPDPAAFTTIDMLRLGFMGAYLFTLQMLIRRYFQTDLKASAYVNAITRVVSALVLVLVVDTAGLQGRSPGTRVAVAFVIGFFPLVGLQAIQKAAAMALRVVVPTLRNDYPLSDLDGLSVWYEARLLESRMSPAELVRVTWWRRPSVSHSRGWAPGVGLLTPADGPCSRRPSRDRDVELGTSPRWRGSPSPSMARRQPPAGTASIAALTWSFTRAPMENSTLRATSAATKAATWPAVSVLTTMGCTTSPAAWPAQWPAWVLGRQLGEWPGRPRRVG